MQLKSRFRWSCRCHSSEFNMQSFKVFLKIVEARGKGFESLVFYYFYVARIEWRRVLQHLIKAVGAPFAEHRVFSYEHGIHINFALPLRLETCLLPETALFVISTCRRDQLSPDDTPFYFSSSASLITFCYAIDEYLVN